jgi:hypothetical protein
MRRTALVTLLALAVGVALIGFAMVCYPGGTVFDRSARGHSFWLNHLCDLTGPNACNGQPNGVTAPAARAGLAAFAAALAAFWLVMPALFPGRPRVALVVRVGGVMSALGLAVLTLVPPGPGPAHALVVFGGVVPGLVAGVVSVVALFRFAGDRLIGMLAAGTLLAGAVDVAIYARKTIVHPDIYTPSIPIIQRLAFLLMLAWMAAVAARVLSRVGTRRASLDAIHRGRSGTL